MLSLIRSLNCRGHIGGRFNGFDELKQQICSRGKENHKNILEQV